jgi:hypothetical protein
MITWFPSLSSIMMRLAGAAHAEVLLGTELPTCFHSEDIISAPAERVRRISECALRVRVVHINQADVAYAHFGDVHRYVTCGCRHLLGVKSRLLRKLDAVSRPCRPMLNPLLLCMRNDGGRKDKHQSKTRRRIGLFLQPGAIRSHNLQRSTAMLRDGITNFQCEHTSSASC